MRAKIVTVGAGNFGAASVGVKGFGFPGFLMGPPLIGYIAEIASLSYSFALIGIFGFGITLMVSRIRAFYDHDL